MDRRDLLRLALVAAVERFPARSAPATNRSPTKVVLVTLAGVRRKETFSTTGLDNIPRLHRDLLP